MCPVRAYGTSGSQPGSSMTGGGSSLGGIAVWLMMLTFGRDVDALAEAAETVTATLAMRQRMTTRTDDDLGPH